MRMKFLKQYSYSNTGAITTHALEGETLEVADKYFDYFIEENIAEPAQDIQEDESVDESIDIESDDDSGSEEESDDLTEVFKITQTTEELLNEKGINTYAQFYEYANTDEGKVWLIDQYGINKNNYPRLLDHLTTLI